MRRKIIAVMSGILLMLGGFLFFFSYTPAVDSQTGIAELRKVRIGGINQCILVRGQNTANPVLLFLHGGAGTTEMGLVRKYNSELEKHFIVVNWDQRAAGKSCTREARSSELSVDRFVKDTLELSEYLRTRFGKDKIYIVGHSWGSIIGLMAVEQCPQYYHAYIGTAQMSDIPRQEQVAYRKVLNIARERGVDQAIRELEKIGPPNHAGRYIDGMKGTSIERKWVTKLGGFLYEESSMLPMMAELLAAPEYSGLDCCRFVRGMMLSKKNRMMETEVLNINLTKMVPRVAVPVHFFLGLHDLNAPASVSAQYLKNMMAPEKHVVWFKHSAHSPCFEESIKFNRELIALLQ